MIGYDFYTEKTSDMNNINFNICGKSFNLKVDFAPDYGKDSDKEFMLKSLTKIYNNKDKISKSLTSSLSKKLLSYIKKDAYSSDVDIKKIDNPFKYIKPTSLYICSPIVYKHEKVIGGILCDYKFDPEHGIVITLGSSGVKDIAPQDYLF